MTNYTQAIQVGASGIASIDFSPTSPGLNWVVAQFSLETQPFRVGCVCVVRYNGRFLSSTILGSGDTAYGPPAIILYRGDILNFTWTGVQVGDECIATLFYNESQWSTSPDPTIAV